MKRIITKQGQRGVVANNGTFFPLHEKSGKNQAKEEALLSFEEFGVNPSWVDIRETGVTIKQFNKMVTRVYQRGYENGRRSYKEFVENQEFAEKSNKYLSKQDKLGKFFKEKSQINKSNQ